MFGGEPRILITGAHGFVGRHLVTALLAILPKGGELILADMREPDAPMLPGCRGCIVDITDADAVDRMVADANPTHLIHLAAIAAVTDASGDIDQAQAINFGGTRNVARAIVKHAPACRLAFCSSAEVYGASFKSGDALDETAPLQPVNAYGRAKADADIMLGDMARDGLKVIRLRPVNHTGRGQGPKFVVPDFASQIAAIERGERPPVMQVGNLSSARDFLDVRDVADAYVRTLAMFDDLPNGSVLNIASGKARVIQAVLDGLLAMSSCAIEVRQSASLFRASDTPIAVCDATRARELLQWQPSHAFADTLADVLDDWRNKI